MSTLYHNEIEGKEDGHPDFEYSRRKLAELDIEEKRRSELLEEALNRMNTRYRMKSSQGTEELEEEENIVRRALPKVGEEKSKNGIISEGKFHFRKAEVEEPRKKRHFPIGKVVGAILLVSVIGGLLWYAPTISSYLQNLTSQSSYTKLTLVVGQYITYDHGDNHYVFAWRLIPTDSPNVFFVGSGFQTQSFPTTLGATYTALGLEIKVSEIHSDYIVLLVKTTY